MLDHALAIRATPTIEEWIGAVVIRDDAEAGKVVITFPDDHTPERRKRIRSAGFLPHGARRAVRLRKIGAGGNVAMEDARRLVRGMLDGGGQERWRETGIPSLHLRSLAWVHWAINVARVLHEPLTD